MVKAAAAALALMLLGLAGCAPAGPPFASVAASVPPVPQGEARLYFYRWLEPYETVAESTVMLNGAPVAVSQTGAVFYRDVHPAATSSRSRARAPIPTSSRR